MWLVTALYLSKSTTTDCYFRKYYQTGRADSSTSTNSKDGVLCVTRDEQTDPGIDATTMRPRGKCFCEWYQYFTKLGSTTTSDC